MANRLRNAFGAEAEQGAQFSGRLAVLSDRRVAGAASDSGSAGCTLEGSVFNLRELAHELGEDPGADTEFLLARAYVRWGEGLLRRLRGAFALVVWNVDASRILLAQDQVGSGALFVHKSDDELVFASEIHHLLALLRRTPPPDEIALVRWMASAKLYDGRTMFEGVRRLGAGRRISIASGQLDQRPYWAPSYEPPLEGSRLELAAQFRDALVRAVGLRTRDAGTVGITLSGGFDSSAVAAAAAAGRQDGQALRGYSTVFLDEPGMNDTHLLDALVEALPIDTVRYSVEPGGMLAMNLMYLRDWQLPMTGPGWVVERPFMERAAADGVKVMLDGQGGDEVFGLPAYLLADRVRSGRLLSAIELVRHGLPGAATGAPWGRTMRIMKDYGLRGAMPHRLYSMQRRLRSPRSQAPGFLSEHASRIIVDTSDELRWAKGASEPRWWLYMRQLLIDDREAAGLGDFVRQRSQWVGIEGRPPLFDVDLIGTALRLPPEFAFDPYLDRPLAREAVAGILPDAVRLSRRKSNLFPFYYRGLTGRDLPLARALLGGDRLEIGPWVRRDVVRDLVENPPAPRTEGWHQWLSAVWGCVTAECWLRSLSERSFAQRTLERANVARIEYEVIN